MPESKNIIDTSNSILPTLSSRAMFWRPKYLNDSQWLEHIPFYFWLTEALKPECILELETTSASSYFAFCQAVEKLNLDSLCYASTGNNESFRPEITNYNDENYQEFSQLLELTSQELINDFDDKVIDILLLKYTDAALFDKTMMEKLQSKLSDKAVVLVHGSQKKELKLICKNLKSSYPTFEFTHGNGLLIVGFGNNLEPKIQSLLSRSGSMPGNRVLHDVYRRLGRGCLDSWNSQSSKLREGKLSREIHQQQQKLQNIADEKSSILDKLHKVEDERKSTEASLRHLRTEKSAFEHQLVSIKKEAQASYQEVESLSTEIAQLKNKSLKSIHEKEELEQSVNTRFHELAELTKLLNQAEKDKNTLQVQLKKTQADLSQSQQKSEQSKRLLESTCKNLKNELEKAYKNIESLKKSNPNQNDNSKELIAEKDRAIAKLTDNNKFLEQDQAFAANTIADLKKENQRLEISLSQRFDELATLTQMLEEKDKTVKEEKVNGGSEYKRKKTINFNILNPKKSRLTKKQKKDYEILKNSEYFDANWYLQQYPDAGNSEKDAITHFILVGAKKGYNPSSEFNMQWYLDSYPDVREEKINPLLHFITFGRNEGRLTRQA